MGGKERGVRGGTVWKGDEGMMERGGERRDCVERDAEKGMRRTVGDVCFLTH